MEKTKMDIEFLTCYAMIQRPAFIQEVCEIITERDFLNTTCRHAFLTLKRMSQDKKQIDIMAFWGESGRPEGIAGKLIEQDEFSIFDPPHYARILRKRNLEEQIKEQAKNREYLEIKAGLTEIENLQKPASLYTISKMIEDGTMPNEKFKTGFYELDKMVAFRPSNVLVLAGKTSIGKSTLGLTWLANMAKETPVGMISFEMALSGIAERLCKMFSLAYIDTINGNLLVAAPEIFSLSQTRKSITEMKKRGIRVVMVDYLQLMSESQQFRSRHLEVSHIIRKLAEMAKEYAVALIVIAQISRSIDGRGPKARPVLGDLKESGDIENSADVVVFIHRPDSSNEAEMIVAKNRYGAKGIIPIVWLPGKTRYDNLSREKSIWGEEED